MTQSDYTEANRRMWNETAAVHEQVRGDSLLERAKSPDFSTFKPVEKRLFAEIGLQGKSVVQLACNNGREIISVKKAGAARCVGFDISDQFIAQGQKLVAASGVEVELVRSSVYDIPHSYDGQFDVVYITIGALGWMPDLVEFFNIVTRLMKPVAQVFIYEMHPILNMFDPDTGLVVKHSYFQTEPLVEEAGPDYLDPTQIVQSKSFWFFHKLSDVLGGCLRNGMVVTHFQEYPDDISAVFKPFEQLELRPPLSYSLIAARQTG
jgi:ubiquinone/menaquinone biosynthesis C-methylase UbiE